MARLHVYHYVGKLKITCKLSEKDDRGAPVAQWASRSPAKLAVWIR